MLAEWLVKFHSSERWLMRVRLGSPKPETPVSELTLEERAMVGSWRRWADAVILGVEKVTIVEAAIRPDPGKISQLELYALLFPHTPELAAFRDLPLSLLLLYAIEDPATVLLARQKGIEAVEYKPLWLDSYLEILTPRERRGPKL
jgi:hypothetical protein